MFGMGQYEKVGDSAKVRIRRGVCYVSRGVFFLYILSSSSFFVARCFVEEIGASNSLSLSLSFFHSFLFVSFVCDSRAAEVVVLLLRCLKLPTTTHHRVLILTAFTIIH